MVNAGCPLRRDAQLNSSARHLQSATGGAGVDGVAGVVDVVARSVAFQFRRAIFRLPRLTPPTEK